MYTDGKDECHMSYIFKSGWRLYLCLVVDGMEYMEIDVRGGIIWTKTFSLFLTKWNHWTKSF